MTILGRVPTKRSQDVKPEARWTVHNRDSWEVVAPTAPTDPPRPSLSQGASLVGETAVPQTPPKSKGLGLLKRRLSKSQLTIKTGPISSVASIGSPSVPPLPPINVNLVITGPTACGVSTLIQRFMTGRVDVRPSLFLSVPNHSYSGYRPPRLMISGIMSSSRSFGAYITTLLKSLDRKSTWTFGEPSLGEHKSSFYAFAWILGNSFAKPSFEYVIYQAFARLIVATARRRYSCRRYDSHRPRRNVSRFCYSTSHH